MTDLSNITGRVWVFGNDINTDAMAPGASLMLQWPEQKAFMFPDHPEFINNVVAGDVIIAGDNFGCGSSREYAVHNLKNLGIAFIAARSFARIFFRNALANALPTVQCSDMQDLFESGATAELNWSNSTLRNSTTGQSTSFAPFTNDMMDILKAGGLVEKLKSMKLG